MNTSIGALFNRTVVGLALATSVILSPVHADEAKTLVFSAIPGVCIKCMAMFGNGVRISMAVQVTQVTTVCCAAARGSATASSAGLLLVAGSIRLTATTTSVSVLPEVSPISIQDEDIYD